MAKHLDPAQYDSIFLGRIEAEPTVFAAWLSGALRIKHELQLTTESFGSALDYRWATGRYEAQAIYLRTFSHHGCPLSCTFCADRLSGSWAVPPGLLEQDLTALHEAFPSRSVLYVGDLTFGVSLAAVKNLSEALNNVQLRAGKAFKLIVQTNASLINRSFVSRLRDLGVVVVEMGIESGDSEAVRRTEKRRPSNEWLEEKIDMIHEAGLRVAGNIVVGLPRDSDSEYTATEEFILKWRSKLWFNVYGFVPYPGTPLYAQLLDERRIVTWDLSKWCEGAPLVFEPYGITADRVHDWLIRMLGHVAKAS